ncbi:MAG: hypothetical protein HYV24_08650 [Deltaproteobacteria bacterium]|nr:hypothetical protein [Deltaproteobacteria bacterium]
MSLSRIYRETGHSAEPFILEDLGLSPSPFETADVTLDDKNVGGNIEAIEREAYERGFAAGEKAGFEFGKQKAEVLFNGIAGLLDSLSSFKETLHKPCEDEMVELCIAISKKVLQRELELKKEGIVDCVRTALKSVVAGGEITIKVNPKDQEILLLHKGELAKYGDGVKGVKIESDESVSKGGCLVDTNFGEIDASIDSVMTEIEEKLKGA